MRAKSNINKCLKYAEKIRNGKEKSVGKKTILGYTCNDQIEDRQIFCDGWFLVALSNEDKVDIPNYTESEWKTYPSIERLINYNVENNGQEYTMNVGKLKAALKQIQKDKNGWFCNTLTIINNGYAITLGEGVPIKFLDFMNFKDSDNITLWRDTNSTMRPLFCRNKNDSFGIVSPCMKNDNDSSITMDIEELQ